MNVEAKLQPLFVNTVALWVFNSFLQYLALFIPWKDPWGGNNWVQISLSYFYYLGYLVLGHFLPFEGCFPLVLFIAALDVSLLHLPFGSSI
jgi:hypothetical protein